MLGLEMSPGRAMEIAVKTREQKNRADVTASAAEACRAALAAAEADKKLPAGKEKTDALVEGVKKVGEAIKKFLEKMGEMLAQFGSGILKKAAEYFKGSPIGDFLLNVAKKPTAQIRHILDTFKEKTLELKLHASSDEDQTAAVRENEKHLADLNRTAELIGKHRKTTYEFEQMILDAIGVETEKKTYTLEDLSTAATNYYKETVLKEVSAAPATAPAKPDLFGVNGLRDEGAAIIVPPGAFSVLHPHGTEYVKFWDKGIRVDDKDYAITLNDQPPQSTHMQINPLKATDPAEVVVTFIQNNAKYVTTLEKIKNATKDGTLDIAGIIVKVTPLKA